MLSRLTNIFALVVLLTVGAVASAAQERVSALESQERESVQGVQEGVLVSDGNSIEVAPGFEQMNIALLGDSNTWIGGEDSDNPRGWNYWFKMTENPCQLSNFSRSGATWTHTALTVSDTGEYSEVITDCNVIFNQVLRLIEAVDSGRIEVPDIVVLSAGTNDAWFAHLRPDEFGVDAAETLRRDREEVLATPPSRLRSLAEAVALDLLMLQRRFPQARTVVLTPMPSVKISAEMLAEVSNRIDTVATGLGASVLRLDLLSPVNAEREMTNRRLTSDGTHTSSEGARRNAELICHFIENLLNKENAPSSEGF